MTLQFFCLGCGIKTDGNTTRGTTGDYHLSCECGFEMRFYIKTERMKTDEEVDAIFQQTKLTDSQRGTKKK
jgi:hypothetical protein